MPFRGNPQRIKKRAGTRSWANPDGNRSLGWDLGADNLVFELWPTFSKMRSLGCGIGLGLVFRRCADYDRTNPHVCIRLPKNANAFFKDHSARLHCWRAQHTILEKPCCARPLPTAYTKNTFGDILPKRRILFKTRY